MRATDFQNSTPLQIVNDDKALSTNDKIYFCSVASTTSGQNISILVNDVSDFSLSLISEVRHHGTF